MTAVLAAASMAAVGASPPRADREGGDRPEFELTAEVEGGTAFVGLPLSAKVRIQAKDRERTVWIATPVAVSWKAVDGVAVQRDRADLAEASPVSILLKPKPLVPGLRYTQSAWVSDDIRFREAGNARLRCRVSLYAGWPGEEESMIATPTIEVECELQVQVAQESEAQRRAVVEAILKDLKTGKWEPVFDALHRIRALPVEDPAITAALGRLCEHEDADFRSAALRALVDGWPRSDAGVVAVRKRILDGEVYIAEAALGWLGKERVLLSEDECKPLMATEEGDRLLVFMNYLVAAGHPRCKALLKELSGHAEKEISEQAKSLLRGVK